MKVQELRDSSNEELNKKLHELLKEQFNLRMQHATGQLPQNHQLKDVKRNIARVKTIINEKANAL